MHESNQGAEPGSRPPNGMLMTVIFSLLAGLVFSFGDMAHVHSGMARYPIWQGPLFYNIPWFVPLEFAAAAFFLIKYSAFLEQKIGLFPPRKTGPVWLGLSFAWTLALYLGTSFLPESHPLLKNAVLLAALSCQVACFEMHSARSLLAISSVAMLGCGFEFLLGQAGFFTYLPSPSLVATIPIWLWFVYGSVAVTARVYSAGRPK